MKRNRPDPKIENTRILFNCLKSKYEEYRSSFINAFKPLYCPVSMDIPRFGEELVAYCRPKNHEELTTENYESLMYMKNIITWIDIKLNYPANEPTSRPIEENKNFKISYIHDKKQTSRICLNFKNSDTSENCLTPEFMNLTDTFNHTNASASYSGTSMNTVLVNENSKENVTRFVEKENDSDEFVNENLETNVIMCVNKEKENTSHELSINTPINDNINNEEEKLGVNDVSNLEKIVDNYKNASHKLSIHDYTPDDNINDVEEQSNISDISSLKENNNGSEVFINADNEKNVLKNTENASHKLSIHDFTPDDNINGIEEQSNKSDIGSLKENDNGSEVFINASDNEKIVSKNTEEKLLSPVQTNFDNTKNISTSLETSSTTIENHSTPFNNKSNKIFGLDELTEQQSKKRFIGKRFISTDSEHTSKKIKLRHNSISLKASKNSTEKNAKNISNNNEETILNIDCVKIDAKNNDSPKTKTKSNQLSTSILKETPKQNVQKINPIQTNDSKKKLIKNMYVRNNKGETKLHTLCAKNKIDSVFEILKDGFNPNVKDNAGWTPLHDAVKNGRLKIVKLLVQFGAYINTPGFEYESPLFTAIKYGQLDVAKELFMKGADIKSVNMYGDNIQNLNEEMWTELSKLKYPSEPLKITEFKYAPENIVIFLSNVLLDSAIINKFCELFGIKLIQNILYGKQLEQVTHIIVPVTENNTCNVKFECLSGIAHGTFIVNQNWIVDSLEHQILQNCDDYEVNGTTSFVDCNGPKLSRINKQKLFPKLFDGISIHITGNIGWENFSLEQLQKLVQEFGAKLLKRMPNSEDCPTNILPFHCRDSEKMRYVSNIILYTEDKNRLIKYNMEHLKVFPISWFMEAAQKYSII